MTFNQVGKKNDMPSENGQWFYNQMVYFFKLDRNK